MTEKPTFNIRDFIKTESPLERLSSLSTTRDLSLGGTKPKKVFTPNLNISRKRSSPKEALTGQSSTTRATKRANRPLRKSKYDTQRFVQTTADCGIFSEGTNVEIHKPKSNRFPYKNEVPSESSTKKSISSRQLTIKTEIKRKPVQTSLLIEDDDETELSSKIQDHLPIFIPLSSNKRSFSENVACSTDHKKSQVKVDRVPYFTSLNHAPNKTPLLSLIKLPEQFTTSESKGEVNSFLLEPGQIGRILVRESGNVDVLLGNVSFTLDPADMCSFMETAMILPAKEDAKKDPNFIELGTISESLVLSPNWDDLFDKISQ